MRIREAVSVLLLSICTSVLFCPAGSWAQEVGDYVYCSPGWGEGGDKSWFGHAAIYVGPQYDGLGNYVGDVVERPASGPIRFTSMENLRGIYSRVSTTPVQDASTSARTAAAERAVAVAMAIQAGQTIPWYSDPYDFPTRNCLQTIQHFYLDVGADTEQVGNPEWLTHPGWAYTNYSRGGSGGIPPGDGTGVGGASGGGVESRPLWQGRSGSSLASPGLSGSMATGLQAEELLAQFLPAVGRQGDLGQRVTPQDVLGGSNAVAAVGMDYTEQGTGRIVSSIFGAETVDSVYEHDYEVCSRVRGYEVIDIGWIPFGQAYWQVIRAVKPSANCDETVIPVSIRLNGNEAVADSRYLVENYPPPMIGTVLNYQIRAADAVDAMYLLDNLLSSVAQAYSLTYANVVEPAVPIVFAHTAGYDRPNIHLAVENRGEARLVRFSGPVWTEPRGGTETQVEFNIQVPAGQSVVDLPVGDMHDAVIYIQAGDFTDKVYVAAGYWFAWDDQASGGTSEVAMMTSGLQHAPLPGTASWFVCPPQAEMTGVVTDVLSWGHVGMGYSFKQAAQPIDISSADSVAFWMKGDGKDYRVKLESASVTDNDFHGATFTTSTDWQVIRIPFSVLTQEGWGQPVAWTGTDIRTISFVTVGRPHASVHLYVDRISFLEAGARTDLIGRAKLGAEGSDAAVFGGVITATFGDSFYAEAVDRSSGIQVHKMGHGLGEGAKVDFGGLLLTNPDGECYVEASGVGQVGEGAIRPAGMTAMLLGGGQTGLQAGVIGGVGLNNIGLLVTTWGRFAKTSETTFTLEDGSGVNLKCIVPTNVTLNPSWNYAVVTGISSCEKVDEELHRLLRVRGQDDIVPL